MQKVAFGKAVKDFEQGNYEASREPLLSLARVGHGEAQCMVGNMYQLGLGVAPDLAIAVEWYTKASQQGHGIATNNLAGMVLTGYNDLSPNPIEAERLFNEARRQGFTSGAPLTAKLDQIVT